MIHVVYTIIILAVRYFERHISYTEGYGDGLRDASRTIDDLLSTNLSESADENGLKSDERSAIMVKTVRV